MPEGLGNAYEKWKIDRLRKRAEEDTTPSKNLGIFLSVFFGWIGLHNLQQKNQSRFSSMASLTGFAYIFSKITNFIDTHSFSQNASPIRDEAGFSYESNFEMRTGRDDWIFSPSDSQLSLNDLTSEPPSDLAPELHDAWYQNALETMHNSWADLMNNELMFLIDYNHQHVYQAYLIDFFYFLKICMHYFYLSLTNNLEYLLEDF